MKTKTLLLILSIGFIIGAFGQKPTLELTFSALHNGQSVPLDSIFIENLTQGGDTMLYAPNSSLLLDYQTSIEDYGTIGGNSFSISQNYPNPFKCKTEFDLHLSQKEKMEIIARDIMGRQLFHYEKLFNPGNHSFAFFANNMGHYLITATSGQASQTIKMFNTGSNTVNRSKCKIVYIESKKIPDLKNQIATNDFLFSIGDELRFTGYTNTIDGVPGSDVQVDTPNTNTSYEFMIIKGLLCPGIPTITDFDGNDYNTVLIGNQCWMKENLKATSYNNGISIPNVTNNNTWQALTTGAYAWFDNDISWKDVYGALYNWSAVINENGICPTNWHLPSDEEWKELEMALGMSQSAADSLSWRGTNEGSKLAGKASLWNNGLLESSSEFELSGFFVLPGGYRNDIGSFNSIGDITDFWTSFEASSTSVLIRGFHYYHRDVCRYSCGKSYGLSVRCVKD